MLNGCFLNNFYQLHVFHWGRGLFRSSHLHSRTLWVQHLTVIIKIVGRSRAPEGVLRTAVKSQGTVCPPAQTSPVGTEASRGRVCCLLTSPQHTSDVQDLSIYHLPSVQMARGDVGSEVGRAGCVQGGCAGSPSGLGLQPWEEPEPTGTQEGTDYVVHLP